MSGAPMLGHASSPPAQPGVAPLSLCRTVPQPRASTKHVQGQQPEEATSFPPRGAPLTRRLREASL